MVPALDTAVLAIPVQLSSPRPPMICRMEIFPALNCEMHQLPFYKPELSGWRSAPLPFPLKPTTQALTGPYNNEVAVTIELKYAPYFDLLLRI